jgi:hypothetical protein
LGFSIPAQGYAAGDNDQNLEYIDKSRTNQINSTDGSEIIKFDFTNYSATINYTSIATTAASAYGTAS